ncbi:MAG: hypothetical protein FWC19_10035, partial [Treponema sp.]|nr:hypothetical protein [Treponema sp.]
MSFPRTTVAGVSLPRMLIGTNWIFGWSHRGHAADTFINEQHSAVDATLRVVGAFTENGIDAMMAPFSTHANISSRVKQIEDKLGKKIIKIDTPILNVDDSEAARREAKAVIKNSADLGCKFCLIHHSSCEQLV